MIVLFHMIVFALFELSMQKSIREIREIAFEVTQALKDIETTKE